jgi:hypothetical protein
MARQQADPHRTAFLKARIHTTLVAAGISHHRFAVLADVSPATLGRYLAGTRWSAATESKLERAIVSLPKSKYRKHPKHRRIDHQGGNHGKA